MSRGAAIPRLSVIVIAFNGPILLERCLSALESQTPPEDVEMIVVGCWNGDAHHERLQRRFPAARWVEAPRGASVPQMRAAGLTLSRAEIIALLEDDCVATERWCANVLLTHQQPFAAIGGAVEPGEYSKALDWAVYFFEYGRFMAPLPQGEPGMLPGTNVSYKRISLAALPPTAAFHETFVHRALRDAGHSLKTDAALVVRNVNAWKPLQALSMQFEHGREFAAVRVSGWPFWRRVPFLGLSVVLPLIQIARVLKHVITRRRRVGRVLQGLPWILLLALCWSAGEFAGYVAGNDTP